MKTRISILLIIFLLCSCTTIRNKDEKDSDFSTVLKLNWIFTGSYAPEATAVTKFAKLNEIQITLEPGGQGKDPLKLVRDNEFGIASADEILRANDKGTEFAIIGVINDYTPACFLSLTEDSIKSPSDFIGKTVGILPFGSTGIVYKILLKKANIDPSLINEITVYPDLRVFISGKTHQIQPAFIYDETVTLDLEGVSYNVIEPKDYGVVFKGPCYFTTKNTISNNPELVQAFINTMIEGTIEAKTNPEEAINALKQIAADIDVQRELLVWKKGMPYYSMQNDMYLYSDMSGWQEMLNELVAMGEIKNQLVLSDIINFTFIEEYYQGKLGPANK